MPDTPPFTPDDSTDKPRDPSSAASKPGGNPESAPAAAPPRSPYGGELKPMGDSVGTGRPGPSNPPPKLRQVIFKPPRFIPRTLLLLAEPHYWAKAALYPLRYTLWPLIFVALISGGIIGSRLAGDGLKQMDRIAKGYDAMYAPMVISNGKLSVVPNSKKPPFHLKSEGISIQIAQGTAVPPSAAATTMVITPTEIDVHEISGQQAMIPMSRVQRLLLAASGSTLSIKTPVAQLPAVQINSASLQDMLQRSGGVIYWLIAWCAGIVAWGLMLLWSAMMGLLALVLVAMMNRDIGMPARVAARIAFAVMVPLVALQAVLALLGFTPGEVSGAALGVLQALWMMAPLAMALWAGTLANRMFKELRNGGSPPRK
ncbi:MAG: hypothetical protein HKL96_13085 [Phycisphaerales bacterium]|nr:hypothetical protein [Phycisphaerales bacterium]